MKEAVIIQPEGKGETAAAHGDQDQLLIWRPACTLGRVLSDASEVIADVLGY